MDTRFDQTAQFSGPASEETPCSTRDYHADGQTHVYRAWSLKSPSLTSDPHEAEPARVEPRGPMTWAKPAFLPSSSPEPGGLPSAPVPRTKTVPYASSPVVRLAAVPRPADDRRKATVMPPVAVTTMLLASLVMLVACGWMVLRAVLDLL